MKFDDIISKLACNEVIEIAGGEVMIKKKLAQVIGGVSVYNLYVEFPKERKEPIEFETIEQLDDYSLMSADSSIRRCLVCDGLPEKGYYYDNEMRQTYCDYACFSHWMNRVYGQGNWKVGTGVFDELKFYVEMDKDLVEDFSFDYNYIIEEGKYFREYDCVYVPPYNSIETVDYSGVYGKIDQELEALTEKIATFNEQHDNMEEKLVEQGDAPTED